MNVEALAVFAGSCSDVERAELAATLRAGVRELQTTRRRNGSGYDPAPVNTLIAALAAPAGGQRWPLSGQDDGRWVTVSRGTRTGVPGRTLRRWAASGRVRSRRAGGVWLVRLDDVERERNNR